MAQQIQPLGRKNLRDENGPEIPAAGTDLAALGAVAGPGLRSEPQRAAVLVARCLKTGREMTEGYTRDAVSAPPVGRQALLTGLALSPTNSACRPA